MTKVFAVNSSHRKDKGNTALILNPFLEGMKEAGAKVDQFYSSSLRIGPCVGDFQCWSKTPGICHQRDDMDKVLESMRQAEIWVLGIPVYALMPGEMQNLMNRTMPLFNGITERREGRMVPQLREEVRIKKLVLVSSCYFWGLDNFEMVLAAAQKFSFYTKAESFFALLRPHALPFHMMIKEGKGKEIIGAASKAGYQLIQEGRIDSTLLDEISRPLLSPEDFLEQYGDMT